MTIFCENCKNWIQMEEDRGECVIYGERTAGDTTCENAEEDDDD